MTDSAKYVDQALAELALVKSEGSLIAWDDVWTNSYDYLALSEQQVRRLEDARDAKLRKLWGVMAG